MAKIEEATLFRPGQVSGGGKGGQAFSGGGGGGGGGRGSSQDDDDGPQIALRERVAEASRSARRRKGLSLVVLLICGALTVLAAIFAPRTYEVESRVLVSPQQPANQQQVYVSPEELKAQQSEYVEQIFAQDNLIAIIKQTNLVERWDEMRQPHRRLIDKLNRKLGKPPPTDEQKFDALLGLLRGRLKVFTDARTVTIKLDWSEPVSAKDIVAAALTNFKESRFQSEIAIIPAKVKVLEASMSAAHNELEAAAEELNRQIKLKDPKRATVTIAALPFRPKADPSDVEADPALAAQLEQTRNELAQAKAAKTQRLAELNNELTQMQQTLAPGHPSVIALKQTIAATEKDTPQIVALKEKERRILDDIAAKKKAAAAANAAAAQKANTPRAAVPTPTAAPTPTVGGAKSLQDAQVQFDAATKKYSDLSNQLDALKLEMEMAKTGFEKKYKITQPAEVPAGPKRPVALIAAALGVLATFMAILAVASLADRFSGLFFEPRDVRDRLGIPVYATFS